jgi:hypothetical protein
MKNHLHYFDLQLGDLEKAAQDKGKKLNKK